MEQVICVAFSGCDLIGHFTNLICSQEREVKKANRELNDAIEKLYKVLLILFTFNFLVLF